MSRRTLAKISIGLGLLSVSLGGFIQLMTPAGVMGGFLPVVCGLLSIAGGLLIWNR